MTALRSISPSPSKAAYAKFPRSASRYAMAGAFVARTAGGVRVAITGAGPTAFRWARPRAPLRAISPLLRSTA
ncbi:MAG: hypothetical protein U1E17_08945 [Geminicoccaceae bacterium]